MVRICALVAVCALIACVSADPAERSRYNSRKRKTARQQFGGRPEKPRPFEPSNTYLPPVTGYPPSGSKPLPTYSEGPSSLSPPYQPTQTEYHPSETYKPSQPTQPTYQPSYQPTDSTGYPPAQTGYPTSPSYQPSQPSYPSSPTYQPSVPSETPYQPSSPTQPPYESSSPSQPTYQPSSPTYQPSQPTYQPSQPTYQPSQPSYKPSQPSYQPSQPSYQPDQTTKPIYVPSETGGSSTSTSSTQTSTTDDDDRHPPHIHDLTVDCGKEMMTINVEFNKPYNGIIYSQDHYNSPDCVYVRENSGKTKYSFTVSLNTCGTRFYSDFQNEGQAYLENVLILQNEIGIQEVWDHIRRVRCLWEGTLKKQLVSSLSVGMLNQITSNFSGDTAMARLDIQVGRGPFAAPANGLVKIGETMTLVVSVTGDAGFDIFVRECVARDQGNRNVVPLTDSNGCVLRSKVFGAFQKTRETGNTGASVIAFAFFNAFKFPDEMDLIIQCEVELCKTDCDVCPNPGSIEPRKRRRRDVIHMGNSTEEPSTVIGKGLRVVFAEDLPQEVSSCVSPPVALWGGALVFLTSILTSIVVSYCWQTRGSAKFS